MPVECSRLEYLNRLSMHVPAKRSVYRAFPASLARLHIHNFITPTGTPTTTDGLFFKYWTVDDTIWLH